MKKGKKFLSLSLAALMVTSMMGAFAACGDEGGTSDSTSTSESSVEEVKTNATLQINADRTNLTDRDDVSDTLYGLFIEDINYAVDGGMYAELVKNRSFEFDTFKPGYSAATKDGTLHGWKEEGASQMAVIDGAEDKTAIATDNAHYVRVTNTEGVSGISNEGFFRSMNIQKSEKYDFSVYLKSDSGYTGDVTVVLTDGKTECARQTIRVNAGASWVKYNAVLEAQETACAGVRCQVLMESTGVLDMDMISLMPQNRALGIYRADMYRAMKDLTPSFVRFPGGCITEGDGLEDAYNWKDSIGNGEFLEIRGVDADGQAYTELTYGDAAVRPTKGNGIWQGNANNPYYMTYGVGFYEYFLLCEEFDALAVPTLSCGISCGGGAKETPYQVAENIDDYIQDALDLVAWACGDPDSSDANEAYWATIRVNMGHEEPFDLKYVGIGNEQSFIPEYYATYEKFVVGLEEAQKANPDLYGDISWIVAGGIDYNNTPNWNKILDRAKNHENFAACMDEHYYTDPEWFLSNTQRYDASKYRERYGDIKVFVGEYASWNNAWWNALCEAAYMTGLERNSDVVIMASYAPLFGTFGGSRTSQWTPDMIFYNDTTLYGTCDYYVQKVFSNNVGDVVLQSSFDDALTFTKAGKEYTALFENVTYDEETGDIIVKIVNASDRAIDINVLLQNAGAIHGTADVTVLQNDKSDVKNSVDALAILPQTSTLTVSGDFQYTAAKQSVTVIRIHPAA